MYYKEQRSRRAFDSIHQKNEPESLESVHSFFLWRLRAANAALKRGILEEGKEASQQQDFAQKLSSKHGTV